MLARAALFTIVLMFSSASVNATAYPTWLVNACSGAECQHSQLNRFVYPKKNVPARLTYASTAQGRNYALEYLNVYDEGKERGIDMAKSVAQTVISVAVPGVGTAVGIGGAIVGIPRCTDRDSRHQLQNWARDDVRAHKFWSQQNKDANEKQARDGAAPYCIPVLGGFLSALDALKSGNLFGVFLGLGNAALDTGTFGAQIPDPVSHAVQMGNYAQQIRDAQEKRRQANAQNPPTPPKSKRQ